jgi:NADH-quinone oxidoreductase subunit A
VEDYLPLVTLLIVGILFATISVTVSKLLAPRHVTKAKTAPYESGIVPSREPPERFPVRFYLVAMIFIIFDIEIIFLYPWAVVYRDLGIFGLWEMVLFAVAVFAAFVYLVGNGALDWGPQKPAGRVFHPGMVGVQRTSETTIRRVGLEGREPVTEPEEEETAA